MSGTEKVIIGGREYQPVKTDGERSIIIWLHGWVFVGRVRREGETVFVSNAAVVRRWGTTGGLGQLAKNGPTADTKLDPCEDLELQKSACVIMRAPGWI